MRFSGVLLALAGCQRLLGFDDVVVAEDPPDSDITLRFTHQHLDNDSARQPRTITEPAPATDVAVTLASGERVAFTSTPDGTFQFTIPSGESSRVVLTTSLGVREIQSTEPMLVYDDLVFGRTDAEPASPGTQLQYGSAADGNGYTVDSTGVWSTTGFVTSSGGKAILDWSGSVPFGGGPAQLVSADRNDQLYFLQFKVETIDNVQQNHIIAAESDNVLMISGSPTVVDSHLGLVGAPTATVHADLAAIDLRIDAVDGFESSPRTATAIIAFAIPSAQRPDRGFLLDFASPTAQSGELSFAMPIPDVFPYPTTMLLNVAHTRTVDFPDGSRQTLGCEYFRYAPLPPGATTLDLTEETNDLGFATAIAIDGIRLDHDDLAIPLSPSTPAIVTWELTGPAELFDVQVFEIGGPVVREYLVDQPRFELDPGFLDPDKRYAVIVIAHRGTAGDFTTPMVPADISIVTSAIFRPAIQ